MKTTTIFLSVLTLVCSATAETVKVKVSQDTWVGALDAEKKLQVSSPNALRVATPGNIKARVYYRRAIFGFDLSTINPKNVSSVTFTATTSKGIDRAYDEGTVLRAYLVSNKISDSFLQSTTSEKSLITAGFYENGYILGNPLAGVVIGDYTTSGSASEQTVNFNFSAEAIADFKKDSNQFATIIIENRTGSNAGFREEHEANAGLAFQSLETPGGTPAELTVTLGAHESKPVLLSVGGIAIGLE